MLRQVYLWRVGYNETIEVSMRKILFAIFVAMFVPVTGFAKCSGDDIGTDYWGRTYGCACSGGGVNEQKSRGNTILAKNPGKILKCDGCWLFCNDRWVQKDGGWCSNVPDQKLNANMIVVMDEARKCWTRRCPDNTYFVGTKDGGIDYSKCVQCTGTNQVAQDGICWNVPCGIGSGDTNPQTKDKVFGTEVVIFNGKCMPICDVQTSGAVYDTEDSTYISIKIMRENAGSVGVTTR